MIPANRETAPKHEGAADGADVTTEAGAGEVATGAETDAKTRVDHDEGAVIGAETDEGGVIGADHDEGAVTRAETDEGAVPEVDLDEGAATAAETAAAANENVAETGAAARGAVADETEATTMAVDGVTAQSLTGQRKATRGTNPLDGMTGEVRTPHEEDDETVIAANVVEERNHTLLGKKYPELKTDNT